MSSTLADRRLLFLAYPFPPSLAIGAVRTWHMARHLARLGWDVTVVTPAPADSFGKSEAVSAARRCEAEGITRVFAGRFLRRPSGQFLKQPLTWLRYAPKALCGKLLQPMGIGLDELWLTSCLRKCGQFKPREYDFVLATGSPFSTFIAARRIARRLNTPYILDYRDPWSLSPLLNRGARLLGRARERSIAEGAAAMLTVSPSWANLQASGLRLSKYPIVISNGYDPEECNAAVPATPKGTSIVYAGSFYEGQREIGPLLKALKLAVEKLPAGGPEITFHYYGDGVQHVTEAAKDVGVEDHVLCHGNVPRGDVLSAIKGSSVAVVIAGIRERTDLAERGIVTGKIFEPLGMGVPILLIAPDGSDATTIVEGSGAGRSFRASQAEAMAKWLLALAREPAKARYLPPKEYSWPFLAARLDEVLRRAVQAWPRAGKVS